MRRLIFCLLAGITATLGMAEVARAQTSTASIAGVVADSARHPIANATVQLIEGSEVAITDSLARFGFQRVQPGPVTVKSPSRPGENCVENQVGNDRSTAKHRGGPIGGRAPRRCMQRRHIRRKSVHFAA